MVLGRAVLITSMPWPVVDPIVVALPLAFVATVAVSLATKPPAEDLLHIA
jgi:SSS family solute:Na+ symporter